MKKILLLVTLISFSCIGQNNPAYHRSGARMPFIQLDTITTTERDALTIPSSASSIIYNSTVDSVQYKIPSGGWKSFGSGSVGDNLGDHTATTDLNMGTFEIHWNSDTSRIRENTGALELESDAGNFITRGGVNNISSAKYDYLIGIDSDNNVSNDHFNVYFGLNTVSNRLLYIVQDGQATLPNTTTSDITTAGAKAIVTKEYADANYSGTDDQTASEVPITDAGGIITVTNVEDALQENRTAIDLNTAKVTNATHTGEVTGATALTIASGVVDSDNIVNGTIDEVDVDASINASLDLADSSVQPSDNISTLTNDEGYIPSDGTGRTAATEYTNLYGQTDAGYTTDGAPAAGTLVFITDASPAESFTGTVIPLDSYYQHDDSGTDTATWTLAASPQNGALVEILINEATEPTITGATQITNSPDFIAATPMILTIKHILGTTYYFFTEL